MLRGSQFTGHKPVPTAVAAAAGRKKKAIVLHVDYPTARRLLRIYEKAGCDCPVCEAIKCLDAVLS